jgi:hypothetical protein
MRCAALVAVVLMATPLIAQDAIEVTPLEPLDLDAIIEDVLEEQQKAIVRTVTSDGVVLRGVDKLDGTVEELSIPAGVPLVFGGLSLTLKECRYPEDNPSGDAFAFLTIDEQGVEIFSGWMIGSSPALNALDHQRYDVWVLRCKTSNTEGG